MVEQLNGVFQPDAFYFIPFLSVEAFFFQKPLPAY
jgi:hypothetical protein